MNKNTLFMALIKGKNSDLKYGIKTEHKDIFSKFKTYKDSDGKLKYRSRETKSHKTSRDFYNAKGQIVFMIRVSSYKIQKKTLIRDFVSDEEVLVEQSFIANHKKEVVENAKLQALYSHYRKKGSTDLINDTKRLKQEIVKFELKDYIIDYNKGYNQKLGVNRTRLSRKGDEFITEKYDENTNTYEYVAGAPVIDKKELFNELESQSLKQEFNYDTF